MSLQDLNWDYPDPHIIEHTATDAEAGKVARYRLRSLPGAADNIGGESVTVVCVHLSILPSQRFDLAVP